MAIRLQFINLIVPVGTLERVFAAQGGFPGFLSAMGAPSNEMLWHDAHLCRVDGAMHWPDMDEAIVVWEHRGLQGLVGVSPKQWWKDFAVCASHKGPTFPCDWLVYDALDNSVYLAGTAKGPVAGPKSLS